MANASNGEPLAYRHAVVLYSSQSAYGTPVAPATSCGLASAAHTMHSSNVRFRGPGSANLITRKGGSTYTEWNLNFPGIQTGMKTLLQRAVRSSGVLPLFTLGLGYQDDQGSPNRDADQIQDCKVNALELGLDVSGGHAPLTGSLSGIGGLVSNLTSLAPATLATPPWMSYEGVVLQEGAAYPLRSLQISVNHNLSRDHVIPGTAPASFVRGHSYLTEHAEVISFNLQRYAEGAVDVQASTLTEYDISIVLTSLDNAATLTIALTDCDYDTKAPGRDENGIFYTFAGECKTWNLS